MQSNLIEQEFDQQMRKLQSMRNRKKRAKNRPTSQTKYPDSYEKRYLIKQTLILLACAFAIPSGAALLVYQNVKITSQEELCLVIFTVLIGALIFFLCFFRCIFEYDTIPENYLFLRRVEEKFDDAGYVYGYRKTKIKVDFKERFFSSEGDDITHAFPQYNIQSILNDETPGIEKVIYPRTNKESLVGYEIPCMEYIIFNGKMEMSALRLYLFTDQPFEFTKPIKLHDDFCRAAMGVYLLHNYNGTLLGADLIRRDLYDMNVIDNWQVLNMHVDDSYAGNFQDQYSRKKMFGDKKSREKQEHTSNIPHDLRGVKKKLAEQIETIDNELSSGYQFRSISLSRWETGYREQLIHILSSNHELDEEVVERVAFILSTIENNLYDATKESERIDNSATVEALESMIKLDGIDSVLGMDINGKETK